ncbi:glyoxylase-like metal-dependent hydrolase (beta-lactamase superfamily II) [Geomicrobium halophilum]|uniref:Glyoxylase-like metal-dependent hydrolase (Beta-lactamase superfamily II) n=1 Tax=Geomicrobium halophilum TaxID=549000 RepID=A0A841PYZ4_9BACL|nr:MBL fold metallo-hydrolase [Geomicrobium halophilum]MBB6449525.1 glyoxylase-like metal-dependent hydrolase (beta-lactamase superfamily II) [Geomicrobium halophilum]
MKEQEQEQENHGPNGLILPMTSKNNGVIEQVTTDVHCLTIQIVNVCMIGDVTRNWVLIDTGMPKCRDDLIGSLEKEFNEVQPPQAIILTHGHFDHVGAVAELADEWQVPVFAHSLEIPYLTGEKDYPEPDPGVEGGLVAKVSRSFPNESIQLGDAVQELPENGGVPFLSEWTWVHTPGHAPGHISLFRERDRLLISGDAVITVKQDELYKVLTQTQEVQGPPRYFTTDWEEAKKSAEKLNHLSPEMLIPGHGMPMFGKELKDGLQTLVQEFDTIAMPDQGEYLQ